MTDDRDVLSALIDREPVDPDVLARVLEDAASRALLVDFVRLRTLAQADEADVPAWTAPATAPRTWMRQPWLRAAAVFLLLTAAAGGGAWIERYVSRERPPEPDRVVQFEPVPGRAR